CDVLEPGNHASTFGGSPLACAAALAVFEVIEKKGFLDKTIEKSGYLREKLERLKSKYNFIREVRGIGLMLGMELDIEGGAIFNGCLERNLIINCTSGNVLRFVPSMTVKKSEIDMAIDITDEVLKTVS
ncbi:MAG: aminotransferase class III-fold pyridoxal phosphate-dependent enzyme, partial [bacterium]|nr:aminotransferase class III-fold pyridoxal phosphate-dependent enzyme [bacterium]